METGNQHYLAQITLHGSTLTKMFEAGNIGDTLTIEQMEAECKTKLSQGIINGARQRCLRNKNIWWECIRGARAYKCCSAPEMIEVGEASIRRVHRASKKAVRKLAAVDTRALDNGQVVKYNTLVAQCGTMAAFSSSSATKALEARKIDSALDLPKLLEQLRNQ